MTLIKISNEPVNKAVASNVSLDSWGELIEITATKPTISYSREVGWEISLEGCTYTPQAFEARFGCLPDLGGFKWTHKHRRKKKIREWFAHRKTSRRGGGRGFKKDDSVP